MGTLCALAVTMMPTALGMQCTIELADGKLNFLRPGKRGVRAEVEVNQSTDSSPASVSISLSCKPGLHYLMKNYKCSLNNREQFMFTEVEWQITMKGKPTQVFLNILPNEQGMQDFNTLYNALKP